jgi:hypothetical protein
LSLLKAHLAASPTVTTESGSRGSRRHRAEWNPSLTARAVSRFEDDRASYLCSATISAVRQTPPSCLHGHSAPSSASCRHCGGPSHAGGRPAMSSSS